MRSLLDLPNEITDKIYGYLIGYQLVDVSPVPWSNVEDEDYNPNIHRPQQCYIIRTVTHGRPDPEKVHACHEAIQIPPLGSSSPSVRKLKYDRDQIDSLTWEESCQSYTDQYRVDIRLEKLQVNLLKLCRRIHNQAVTILYTTNIFTFKNEAKLKWFLSNLSRRSISQIRHIRINMNPSFTCMEEYKNVLESQARFIPEFESFFGGDTWETDTEWATYLERLSNLKTVHVATCPTDWNMFRFRWLFPLLYLRRLCLPHASFIVDRKSVPHFPDSRTDWRTIERDAQLQVDLDKYINGDSDAYQAVQSFFKELYLEPMPWPPAHDRRIKVTWWSYVDMERDIDFGIEMLRATQNT